MSPEQARGQAVDKRADVWAFGCVLYELLTGRMAFAGATVPDTLTAVLQGEPDWTALPAGVPPAVTTLLRRCLEKDVRQRRRDIGDVRAELVDALAQPGGATPPASTPRLTSRRFLPLAVVAGVIAAAATRRLGRAGGPGRRCRKRACARITDLVGMEEMPAVSPDGKDVAFVAPGRRPPADLAAPAHGRPSPPDHPRCRRSRLSPMDTRLEHDRVLHAGGEGRRSRQALGDPRAWRHGAAQLGAGDHRGRCQS